MTQITLTLPPPPLPGLKKNKLEDTRKKSPLIIIFICVIDVNGQ